MEDRDSYTVEEVARMLETAAAFEERLEELVGLKGRYNEVFDKYRKLVYNEYDHAIDAIPLNVREMIKKRKNGTGHLNSLVLDDKASLQKFAKDSLTAIARREGLNLTKVREELDKNF